MSNTVHTHEEIQLRAYQLWRGRGEPLGTPEIDWLRAEHELIDEKTGLVELGGALGSVMTRFTDILPQSH